ncbi:MAG: hypothetical protein NT129_06545 [Candidatus Aenigmarchaeota archaeon]|nr:hypothetical protein [Candidatus Aenigmarchaeota archaeon]
MKGKLKMRDVENDIVCETKQKDIGELKPTKKTMVEIARSFGIFKLGILNLDEDEVKSTLKGCKNIEVLTLKPNSLKDWKGLIMHKQILGVVLRIEGKKTWQPEDYRKVANSLAVKFDPSVKITWSYCVAKDNKPKVIVMMGTK